MPDFGWSLTKNDNAHASSTQSSQASNSGPPAPGDRWQGGGADPNGTQNQYGQQTGGRYVDPTYQTDANGRQLSPEEQQYWRDYDKARAERASIARSNGYGRGGNSSSSISGIEYNARTGKWQYYDTKTKGWAEGDSISDIYNTLFNDQQRSEHPLFYYQNLQDQQNQSEESRIQNNYRQSQNDALMSTPTTRYQPIRF